MPPTFLHTHMLYYTPTTFTFLLHTCLHNYYIYSTPISIAIFKNYKYYFQYNIMEHQLLLLLLHILLLLQNQSLYISKIRAATASRVYIRSSSKLFTIPHSISYHKSILDPNHMHQAQRLGRKLQMNNNNNNIIHCIPAMDKNNSNGIIKEFYYSPLYKRQLFS